MNIQIFDPAMCCSSGMCGPDIDPVLVKMNDAVLTLKKRINQKAGSKNRTL